MELLKRMLNYAVRCKRLESNPLAGVPLLKRPNVRSVVIDEEMFQRLHDAADERLQPMLLVAFDGGLRLGEVRKLRWDQVRDGAIRLTPHDDKEEGHKIVPLSPRVAEMLETLPRHIRSPFVFANPKTARPWNSRTVTEWRQAAATAAGLDGLWFHDLRRSFATKARRAGVPESVVMRITGHRTRAVFERYNIISEDDLHDAMARIETQRVGEDLDEVAV